MGYWKVLKTFLDIWTILVRTIRDGVMLRNKFATATIVHQYRFVMNDSINLCTCSDFSNFILTMLHMILVSFAINAYSFSPGNIQVVLINNMQYIMVLLRIKYECSYTHSLLMGIEGPSKGQFMVWTTWKVVISDASFTSLSRTWMINLSIKN